MSDPVTLLTVGSAAVNAIGNWSAGEQQKTGVSNARGDISKYYDQARQDITRGQEKALTGYTPYTTAGTTALDQYQKALAGGYDMEGNPVYQYQKSLMEKNLGQQLSAMGKSRSGNSLNAYYAPAYQSLMANTYQQYLSNLNPLIQTGYGAQQNVAGIYGQGGSNLANLATGMGSEMASASQAMGNIGAKQTAGIFSSVGQGMGNYQAGLQNQEMMGQYKDMFSNLNSANFFNSPIPQNVLPMNNIAQPSNSYSDLLNMKLTY